MPRKMPVVADCAVEPSLWSGSCVHTECTMHQLSPYIGKMKSTMVSALVEAYTKPGDTVLDPFVGSGTVALECLFAGRHVICSDVNPYAIVLTRGKIEVPPSLQISLQKATKYLDEMEAIAPSLSFEGVPRWVRDFFHPRTLKEILAMVTMLEENQEYLLLSCLLGILHHQRPGFLSYPSSHLVPYKRTKKFPKRKFPELYEYRDVRSRLLAKVRRAYRRYPGIGMHLSATCLKKGVTELRLEEESMDAVITSPPYMNALDYARDNRLRMWFLGVRRFRHYDKKSNTRERFVRLMKESLLTMQHALKPRGKCVLVVGEANRNRANCDNAEMVIHLALEEVGGFKLVETVDDQIPDVRRARRNTSCTKQEKIIILEKL